MPLSSSLACTAVAPAAQPPGRGRDAALPAGAKRRGNPNLHFAPRCGARTRAGCPCRAPAIRGKLRCRMHGGRSTGPRTAEGLARLRAARTIHGRYTPEWRARNRCILSFARRGQVFRGALENLDVLPLELVVRFGQQPPELQMPPFATRGISAAEDRAILRFEREALAPWQQAIARARQVRRLGAAVSGAAETQHKAVPPKPHAPVQTRRDPGAAENPAVSAQADPSPKPHAPERAGAIGTTAPRAASPAQTKAHAPEHRTGDGATSATRSPAGPVPPQPKAHAPERRVATGTTAPIAPSAAETKAHAPEPAPPTAQPATPPNRAARRWLRKQERLQLKRQARSAA